MSNRQVFKLFCPTPGNLQVKARYVPATNLEELIKNGTASFRLNPPCEIVSSDGTIIDDDEVLLLLKDTIPLHIRQCERECSDSSSEASSHSSSSNSTASGSSSTESSNSSSTQSSSGVSFLECSYSDVSRRSSSSGYRTVCTLMTASDEDFTSASASVSPPASPIPSQSSRLSSQSLSSPQASSSTCSTDIPETPSPSSSSCGSPDPTTIPAPINVYDVVKILREKRMGIRGDPAIQIVQKLTDCEVADKHNRDLLIRATGGWLMTNPTASVTRRSVHNPTSSEFFNMAKSIVFAFPSMGNKGSKKPWDLLYDENTRKGELESYVRGKRYRMGLSQKREGPDAKRKRTMLDKDDVTDEDILQAERFMRNTPLDPPEKRNSNRCQMLHYFRITRPSRRRFIAEKKVASSVVLNKYPRLKDMQEAVDDEYASLQHSSPKMFVQNWMRVTSNIVEVAKRELNNVEHQKVVAEAEEAHTNFDQEGITLCTLKLLLFLLPNNKPSEKRNRNRIHTDHALPLIYKKIETFMLPEQAVQQETDEMSLPGIFQIGRQFFVKVDDIAIYLPNAVSKIEEAVAYLVMYYYILDLNYPEPLKFVYGLLEHLFQIEKPSMQSKNVKRVYALLCPFVPEAPNNVTSPQQ